MPRITTTAPRKAKRAAALHTSEKFDYGQAKQSLAANTKAHQKASKTTQAYEGHIQRGKNYLLEFAAEERLIQARFAAGHHDDGNNTGEGEEEAFDGEQNLSIDPKFVYAFDEEPNEHTPTAIAMFMNFKCFEQGLGGGTAYSIYSAFKWYYDSMCGDKYRGKWHHDDVTGKCYGNPCGSAAVKDILESCQNKDGESERTHSKATSIDDMEAMFAQSLKDCPADFVPRTPEGVAFAAKHLLWRAVSSFGFTVWTRNFETANFRYGFIDFLGRGRPKYSANPLEQLPFIRLSLRERKCWQKKMKTGELQMNGHVYNIYPLSKSTTTPSIDLYRHLLNWLNFAEKYLLGRPWHSNDHVFPKISRHIIHPDTSMSPDAMGKFIQEMATAANIPNASLFTTHCFRRGGAQYRFMFAPIGQRWTLSRIRWWGGWALGERRDTLIRYLLDELYTYEEDHSDALKPGGPDIPSSGSHAGEVFETQALTVTEGKQMLADFTRQVLSHLEDSMKTQIAHLNDTFTHFTIKSLNVPSSISNSPTALTLPPTSLQQYSTQHFPPFAIPNQFIPVPSTLPATVAPHHWPNASLVDFNHQLGTTWGLSWAGYGGFDSPNPSGLHSGSSLLCMPPPPIPAAIPHPSSSQRDTTFSIGVTQVPQGRQCGLSSASTPPFTASPWRIPEISHSAGSEGWRQVVHNWKYPSPPELTVALKDWEDSWWKGEGKQTVLYGQRKMVAEEFIYRHKENSHSFLREYGESVKNVTTLVKAIRARRQADGQAEYRQRKARI